MKIQSILLLIIFLPISNQTIISKPTTLTTLTIAKESHEDQCLNTLLLTQWHIPKNKTPTVSNVIDRLTVIYCKFDQETFNHIKVEINDKKSPSIKSLQRYVSDKNKMFCNFQSTKDQFYTIRLELNDNNTKKELSFDLNTLQPSSNSTNYYRLSTKLYSNTFYLDYFYENINEYNKTYNKVNNWVEVVNPVFTIKHKFKNGENKLSFDFVRIFDSNENYEEYVNVDKFDKKDFVVGTFENINKLNAKYNKQENYDSYNNKNEILLIFEYISDKYTEYNSQNVDSSLIEYINRYKEANNDKTNLTAKITVNSEKDIYLTFEMVKNGNHAKITPSDIFTEFPYKEPKTAENETRQQINSNIKEDQLKKNKKRKFNNKDTIIDNTDKIGNFLLVPLITFCVLSVGLIVIFGILKFRSVRKLRKRRYNNDEVDELEMKIYKNDEKSK